MNEIEKMYENAGIENELQGFHCHRNWDICENEHKCKICKHSELIYSVPFTAEKELKLIKWFAHSGHFSHQTDYLPWLVDDIARNINFIWKVLTDEEKQQIRKILDE